MSVDHPLLFIRFFARITLVAVYDDSSWASPMIDQQHFSVVHESVHERRHHDFSPSARLA